MNSLGRSAPCPLQIDVGEMMSKYNKRGVLALATGCMILASLDCMAIRPREDREMYHDNRGRSTAGDPSHEQRDLDAEKERRRLEEEKERRLEWERRDLKRREQLDYCLLGSDR